MNELISIIIPTYNRSYILRDTLESIRTQTYTLWECIVVDDGSTDNTEELLEDYCSKDTRFQYHQRPKNRLKGPNSCRNYGFELSKGDFINFFDSDDLFEPNAFEKLIARFSEDTDMVVTGVKKFTVTIDHCIGTNTIYSDRLIEDYLIGKVNFYTEGPLWRRSFLEQQPELFDEHIRNLDDWDFILRMLYQLPKLKYLDEHVIHHRVHQNSLSQELNKNNRSEVRSAFKARYKHVKLIQKNQIVNPKILNDYIFIQYKRFIKQAFEKKDLRLFIFILKLYLRHNVFNFLLNK